MIGTLSTSGKKCLELGKTQDLIPGTVLEPSLTRINIDSLRSLLLAKKKTNRNPVFYTSCNSFFKLLVYDRTTNFTELPNRTELEKNYRTELYRTEPLPNYLLYRFQFFHYKKFSLCILARISVSICYKYGYVRSKNHTKFNFFKNRLKIFFIN